MAKRLIRGVAVMFACALMAVGCSSSDSKKGADAIIGKWNWNKLVIKGVTWDPKKPNTFTPGGSTTISLDVIHQLDPKIGVVLTMTFNEDKTLVVAGNLTYPGEQPLSGTGAATWSVSDNLLTISATDTKGKTVTTTSEFTASGSKLTIIISNKQLLDALSNGDVNAYMARLTPAQQQLIRGLSGSVEFTK